MRLEHLSHEQSRSLPAYGDVFLVTALDADLRSGRVIRESHVFIPEAGRHLHEIVFSAARVGCPEACLIEDASLATRELFLRHVAAQELHLRSHATPARALVLRRLPGHPFFDLLLAGKFREEFWQIQDWTISSELRAVLARLTAYRFDFGEAELLARIFTDRAFGALPAA